MRLKVQVRLRPTPSTPGVEGVRHEHRLLYLTDPVRGHQSEFVFDKVIATEAQQADVFNEVRFQVAAVARELGACAHTSPALSMSPSSAWMAAWGRKGMPS
jgi:hypothetical protein